MRPNKTKLSAAVVILATGAAACQYPEPYVFAYREFDRSSSAFRHEPPDRTWATVCARPFRAPDANIAALAEQACQKHGKSAVEAGHQFGICPLLLASAVVYRCTSPAS